MRSVIFAGGSWQRVSCENGAVVGLDLSGCGVNGTLQEDIGEAKKT